MTRVLQALPSPPPARHAPEAGACRGRRRRKATEKSLHRVLLAGRERHREGMRRLHAYLWSKHAAAQIVAWFGEPARVRPTAPEPHQFTRPKCLRVTGARL